MVRPKCSSMQTWLHNCQVVYILIYTYAIDTIYEQLGNKYDENNCECRELHL